MRCSCASLPWAKLLAGEQLGMWWLPAAGDAGALPPLAGAGAALAGGDDLEVIGGGGSRPRVRVRVRSRVWQRGRAAAVPGRRAAHEHRAAARRVLRGARQPGLRRRAGAPAAPCR